jgi:hypothetical protein
MTVHSKRMQLAEEFATAARLYAEAVVWLTSDSGASAQDYYRLLEKLQKPSSARSLHGLRSRNTSICIGARRKCRRSITGRFSDAQIEPVPNYRIPQL